MQTQVRAQLTVAATPEAVFDLVADSQNFVHFFRPLGPIPGVLRCDTLPGSPGALEHRNVHMTNGSVTEEQVTVSDRPTLYRYRWLSRPIAPLHWLIRAADSSWYFEPTRSGTRLSWTYTFTLTSPLAYPAAILFCQIFKRWMAAGLERIKSTTLAT
jgi:hypothetical protein